MSGPSMPLIGDIALEDRLAALVFFYDLILIDQPGAQQRSQQRIVIDHSDDRRARGHRFYRISK